jgi:hypothetical protein
MTAHQPNFFAYSGVLRKATLNFVLAKKLEAALKIPVVSFFGIADQDFTDDRWVRSCELPAVQRSGGRLSIEVKLPEKLMLNKVPKPSCDMLSTWKSIVEKWLNDAIMSIDRLSKQLGVNKLCSVSCVTKLNENFGSFWKITEDCWERSKTYSDFNSFLMSRIVSDAWGYDTVFARFSECQQAFAEDFSFLLSRFNDYSRLLEEAMTMPHAAGINGGVSSQEPFLAPFWYHCHCGSKVKLFLEEKEGSLIGKGDCMRCGEHYLLNLGDKDNPETISIASQISARAIPMGLVFFEGLKPSCYVGGVGGLAYLNEAEHVAKGLGIPFPPIVVWRPCDKYLGVGQAEALLQLRTICRKFNAQDASTAKNLLEARISQIQNQLGELEMLKNETAQELKKHPNDERLSRKMKEVSVKRTDVVKFSQLSVVSHELRTLDNASKIPYLMSTVIDYAVNVGLKETSTQWVRYLNEIGDFASAVRLETVLSRDDAFRQFFADDDLLAQ